MMWARVIPLAVVAIVALLILVLVLWTRNMDRKYRARDRRIAEERWDNECKFDNPETGAKCERKEFHLENHYHDVGGRLVYWP